MTEEKQSDDIIPREEGEFACGDAESLRSQLEEALREKRQFRTLAQRAQADLVNYKRRAAGQQEDLRRSANASLILKFLGVVDDFSRAADSIPEDASSEWREGFDLVQRSLERMLESEGVSRIEAAGKPFDPSEHEAVLHYETPHEEDGAVVQVTREGYKLNERVLRAAQVIVAKAPTDTETDAGQQQI